jgi:hypothetical protein
MKFNEKEDRLFLIFCWLKERKKYVKMGKSVRERVLSETGRLTKWISRKIVKLYIFQHDLCFDVVI